MNEDLLRKIQEMRSAGAQDVQTNVPPEPHWTKPIRKDIGGFRGMEVRTCFLNVPNEEQKRVVEEIVRDETIQLGYDLFEIACSEATETTFHGNWILKLNEPGVRAYPDWWSDRPARVVIRDVNGLTGDAIPAIGAITNPQSQRDRACKWMIVFVVTPEDKVPYSVIQNDGPSIKKIYDLEDLGWEPGASISPGE